MKSSCKEGQLWSENQVLEFVTSGDGSSEGTDSVQG